jgi:predicted branched-subunit amino acid permease
MSIAVAPGFDGPAWRRLLASQLIVDESWALSARGGGRFDVPVLIGAGLVLYPLWVGSTAVGALAGDLVGDPARLGLDAAFPALFLALLVPMVRTRRALAATLLGAGIAFALVPVTAPGVPIIAASAACLLGLRR